jgi:hypothetical protein
MTNLEKFEVKRVLPFVSHRFKEYNIKKGYKLKNFTYHEPKRSIIPGFIKLLYGDNETYLNGDLAVVSMEGKAKNSWILKEIINIVKTTKVNGYGYPVCSIEIQYYNDVVFKPCYLILPENFRNNGYWDEENFTNEFSDVIIKYYGGNEIEETTGNVNVEGYHDLMRAMVKGIMSENK